MTQADEDALLAALAHARAVRIVVERTEGSVPRDAGTWMAVIDGQDALIGTIGGGRLEHDAIAHARTLLAAGGTQVGLTDDRRSFRDKAHLQNTPATQQRYALGPSLGQCCGGVVHLRFETHDVHTRTALRADFESAHAGARPVALFGGGHVGRAIVRALAPLPVRLHWIDSREEIFPTAHELGLADWPRHVHTEHSQPVQHAVRDLAPNSRVLIMSFSHAEDLDILIECLLRQRARSDLPFIGLIGSRTKWATFKHRLEARGFSAAEIGHVTSPIGVGGVKGKEPAVIAAAVAAQLLSL
jgi:xanthine dehydrogenase accessory factor